jgi:hypothetical protein
MYGNSEHDSFDLSLTKFLIADGETLAVCNPNKDKLDCYGMERASSIKYNRVKKNKDFEKCITNEPRAKCFNKNFPDDS